MTDLNQHIAHLSAEQRALLATRIQDKKAAANSKQTIARLPRVGRTYSFPMSFAQQRLWFLDQLEPGSTSYNTPRAIRLDGCLQIKPLQRAIMDIVARHETLRTRFITQDGEPLQLIIPDISVAMPIVDLGHLSGIIQQQEVERLAAADVNQPFDLTTGPLLRTTLLHLGEQRHILLLTIHHVVSDAWSMSVFFKELATLYEAFSTDRPSPLPDLPIQYADFSQWQRAYLQGETLNVQLGYWKRQLQDLPSRLELPTDRAHSTPPEVSGASQSLTLPQVMSDSLNVLNRRAGVTVYMSLLAVFALLLSRYTGQRDIVLGSPSAGRTRIETEGLIGFFINNLVLRIDISGNPTFISLLTLVRTVTLDAYTHQDIPFEKLVEELQPEREINRNPLFDVMVNFVNLPRRPLELSGLTLSQVELLNPQSKFMMTLYVHQSENRLTLDLVYKSELFSAERMGAFMHQFAFLLEQVVADPERPVQSYSLITPDARGILPDPTEPLPEPRYESCMAAFLSWAARAPQHPALCQAGACWSYGELANCAQTIAYSLLSQKLNSGEVVAVMGARSFGLIAGILAVLLARGVLLTVDSALPAQRQRLMLEQAGARRILYFGDNYEEVKTEFTALSVTCIAAGTGLILEPDSALASDIVGIKLPEPQPDDPAYIFFTSGTTGMPKGILGCHKGLDHFFHWQRETFSVGPADRCAQLIGLSFDAMLRDILLPLTSGASLHLPGSDTTGSDIIAWLKIEKITLLTAVPTLAQSWLHDSQEGVVLDSLRWLIFTGEPLTDVLVQRWSELLSEQGAMANFYGPTETTLIKCCYQVPTRFAAGIQPIGRPLPDTQLLILGDSGGLCGIGEAGEIAIRTPFRTLGYINMPEENTRRFVRNPFRDDPQDLIYYTGDRGRYRPDGMLEILGRVDDQVKIRGVRIEPGEINAILSQHPAVKTCAVLAHKDQQGQSFLAAYVVVQDAVVSTNELRVYLGRQLPAAVIPAAFVILDSLPLTPSGKLDRRALPVPESMGDPEASVFVAPRTPVEELLAAIWSDVLKRPQVGVHDNFFALGGHSLLATQLISRLRQDLKIELPLLALFEQPTIAGLAVAIGQRQIEQAAPDEMARLLSELEAMP